MDATTGWRMTGMNKHAEQFVETFVKELEEENVAIFAGAGLSVEAGYVDWKKLLQPIADDLGLDIDKEHDLISIAQYHLNEKQNRSGLNRALIEKLSPGHAPTDKHRILARLPIKTYWTTNYDKLLEDSLRAANKTPDVKFTLDHLKLTRPKRDAIVYKMHGDIDNPDDAVLTKDDYERYESTRGQYVTALSGDLVAKMFLFLGFSFTDPNLDYILSRVRVSLRGKPRDHYCIFKKCLRASFRDDDAFRYAEVKQQLAINDLKRFGVQTLLVDEYADITILLKQIENRYQRKTVFISGSAHEYGIWTQAQAESFVRSLSQALIGNDNRIVSGFGLGVGSQVITGTLEELYQHQGKHLHDQLILRPFPQGADAQKQWEYYRQEMIAHAGVAVFVFGNKLEAGNVVPANGVRREFEIAKAKGLLLIPVGATGSMAKELWQEVTNHFDDYYPAHAALKPLFESLGDPKDSKRLIDAVIDIINKAKGR
jgi:Sir2- and TIR-associating SLOG family/SIR2-like domain